MQNGQNLEIRASTSQICPVRYVCIPLGGREGATLKEEAAFSCRLRNASSIKSRRRRERKEVAKKEAKYAAGHNPYGGQRGREKTLVEKAAKALGDGSIDGERSRCIFPYLPLLSSSRSAIGKRRNKLPPAGDASTAAIQTELLRLPLSLFFDHSLRVGVGGPLYPYCTYTKHNKALPISPCPSSPPFFLFRFRLVHCLLSRVRFHQL